MQQAMTQSPEHSTSFIPKFDTSGLLTAVIVDAAHGAVLMVGHMDAEALRATQDSGLVHFHSRSRDKLWRKGETSGNFLRLVEILIDCDQDALLIRAKPEGPTCHTGADSCFYRRLEGDILVSVRD